MSASASVAAAVVAASVTASTERKLTISRGRMAFHSDHAEDRTNRIYVYFCSEKNVSKAAMKK